MLIAWKTATTCTDCGGEWDGFMLRQTRINKRSLRATDQGLGAFRRQCPHCGGSKPTDGFRYVGIHDDDLAKVNDYRERKGWAPLTNEWEGQQ